MFDACPIGTRTISRLLSPSQALSHQLSPSLRSSMAISRLIFRSASTSLSVKYVLTQTLRFMSTSTTPSHHNQHLFQQEFSKPNEFLGSWRSPKDPKEAEANLAQLRREYAKQVKELRKQYIYEMEVHRQKKKLKDEAKREAIRLAREERKAAKAAIAQARAAERKALEKEFRQTLLKERAEKLAYRRSREKRLKDKKNEKTAFASAEFHVGG